MLFTTSVTILTKTLNLYKKIHIVYYPISIQETILIRETVQLKIFL